MVVKLEKHPECNTNLQNSFRKSPRTCQECAPGLGIASTKSGKPPGQAAARQGITPRYVQMLFEDTGTTFTAFALEQRLDLARRMLTSPRFAKRSIVSIALDAGFGDLSYFNRCFKRRYHMTPSDLRIGIPCRDAVR